MKVAGYKFLLFRTNHGNAQINKINCGESWSLTPWRDMTLIMCRVSCREDIVWRLKFESCRLFKYVEFLMSIRSWVPVQNHSRRSTKSLLCPYFVKVNRLYTWESIKIWKRNSDVNHIIGSHIYFTVTFGFLLMILFCFSILYWIFVKKGDLLYQTGHKLHSI